MEKNRQIGEIKRKEIRVKKTEMTANQTKKCIEKINIVVYTI